MANSWNESGTTWSQGDWGQQNITTVVLSGLSITSSLGTVEAFPESGWGSDTWGAENWGESGLTIPVTGYSITSSLGTLDYAASIAGWGRDSWGENDWGDSSLSVTLSGFSITGSLNAAGVDSFPNTGWGRDFWGEEPWGDSFDPVVSLTGFSITGYLGTLPYAQSTSGWGRDEWGYGNWGENTTTVVLTDSFAITAAQGPSGWGLSPWEEQVAWGGDLRFETTQLSITSLTGIEATLSLGTPTPNYDFLLDLTGLGPAQMGAGLGVPNINDGSDHSQGVASLLITGSLGSVGHEMVYALTGFEATMSLGTAVANNAEIINITDSLLVTGSLGSLTVGDMSIGLTGFAGTMSLGSLTVTDMQVGLSGIEMSGTLGSAGMSPLYYKDVDITGNTSYTYVKHAGEL